MSWWMVQPFKRGLNRKKKKTWCQIEKINKNGTVKNKKRVSNRKMKKKSCRHQKRCQTAKKDKQKK